MQGSFQRLKTFPFCPAAPADVMFLQTSEAMHDQRMAQMLKKPSCKAKRGLWILSRDIRIQLK